MRLDLLDNTGDRFDYFRFDKSSGPLASEAPLRLVSRLAREDGWRPGAPIARHGPPQRVQTGLRTCCGALAVLLDEI